MEKLLIKNPEIVRDVNLDEEELQILRYALERTYRSSKGVSDPKAKELIKKLDFEWLPVNCLGVPSPRFQQNP